MRREGSVDMLLRYIVSNYKSIGHNIEFSMLPASEDIDDRFVTTISTKMGDWKVLRRGGLFGPNASGKSSFIQSVQYAKSMIVDGRKSGGTTGVNPFRGNLKSIGDQSTFQFVIYADGDVYEYGFSVTRSRVSEEWLSILTENNMQEIFQRTTDIEGYTDIKVNDEFYDKENAGLISILINSMKKEQKNQLFLYKLFDNAIDVAKPLVNWFNEIQLIYPNTKVKGLPLAIKSNKDFRKYISESLRNLDTGVESIYVSEQPIDLYEYADKMKLSMQDISTIENIKNGIVNIEGTYFLLQYDANRTSEKTLLYKLEFRHFLNGKRVVFDFDEESDGTQRLTDLLPMIFSLKMKSKQIFFVDEIDRSLHTKLSQYLLNSFIADKEINNQIIFTAHDVNLINLDYFAQDEIWLMDKINTGETTVRSLSDYNIEEDQNVLKGYLNGRFGAVPVIRRGAM